MVILEDDFPDPSVVQQWRHFSRYVVSLMAPDLNITDLRLLVKPDFDDVFQKFEADDPMVRLLCISEFGLEFRLWRECQAQRVAIVNKETERVNEHAKCSV